MFVKKSCCMVNWKKPGDGGLSNLKKEHGHIITITVSVKLETDHRTRHCHMRLLCRSSQCKKNSLSKILTRECLELCKECLQGKLSWVVPHWCFFRIKNVLVLKMDSFSVTEHPSSYLWRCIWWRWWWMVLSPCSQPSHDRWWSCCKSSPRLWNLSRRGTLKFEKCLEWTAVRGCLATAMRHCLDWQFGTRIDPRSSTCHRATDCCWQ